MSWTSVCWCALALAMVAAATPAIKESKSSEAMTKPEPQMPVVAPVADMAIVADADIKTSTERPSVPSEAATSAKQELAAVAPLPDTQRHTVGDFIIQPLIAFKPRVPEETGVAAAGRQAASSTTPSPWQQFFTFNPGSIAGSVTGWLNDRIQLPGLVDTPVRETSSSSSSTTTTTARPDVVVRVQHRSTTTRRPFISLANRPNRFGNGGGGGGGGNFDYDYQELDYDMPLHNNNNNNNYNRRRKYNNNNNNNNNNYEIDDEDEDAYSEEYNNHRDSEEDDDDGGGERYQRRKHSSSEDSDEDREEDDGDEEEEDHSQRPNNKRRPLRKRRRGSQNHYRSQQESSNSNRRRPDSSAESDEEEHHDDDSDTDNDFYYGSDSRPATKRSQSPASNFIQRGQQSLMQQIRQLTRVQSPAEIGALMRRPAPVAANQRAPAAATLFVNRNGQTVYMAPELISAGLPLGGATAQYAPYYTSAAAAAAPVPQMVVKTRGSAFPQPPLTKPLRLKGQPTQYITIPWNQLGISPPNRMMSLAGDLQAEPHILNIPQSAITAMQQAPATRRKKRPILTADAVPLLAEASLMDVFQPVQIPGSRTPAATLNGHAGATKPGATLPNAAIVTAKARPANASPLVVVPQRVRAGTIVEKAPAIESPAADAADAENDEEQDEVADEEPVAEASQPQQATASELRHAHNGEYIVVGDDAEPGLTRQVQPVYGDARRRYVQPYFEVLQPRARFAVRGRGRSLADPETAAAPKPSSDADTSAVKSDEPKQEEHQIPVKIVEEAGAADKKPQPQDAEVPAKQAPIGDTAVKSEAQA